MKHFPHFRFTIWLGLVLLAGCAAPEKKESVTNFEFSLSEKFRTLPLPEDVGQFMLMPQAGDDTYFYLFDFKTNQLLVYTIVDGQLYNSIKFESEGPNGVGANVFSFYAESPDEVYVSAGVNTIFRFDSKGVVMEKITIDTKELEEKGISLFSNIFYKKDNSLYFAAFPMVFAWTELGPKALTEIPNLVRYDLTEKSFSPLSYFPAEFVGDNLNKSIFPLLTKGPNEVPMINLNFRNIYRISDDSVLTSFAGHSKFPHDPPVSASPNMFEDMPEIMKIINHVAIYTELVFFENLDLIVRVAKFEDIPENVLDDESFVASRWGLVFLDREFNKIGEMELEPGKYNGRYIFADEEGIWISTDHPDNPDLSEDVLRFQLIAVKK